MSTLRGNRGPILAIIVASWFFAVGVRFVVPALLPYIRAESGFGLAVSGSLMAVLFAGYALGQLPGGVIGDRIGERNVLVIGLTMLTFGVFLVTVLRAVEGLTVGLFLMSLGCGIFAPARFTILSDVFDDREGTAHGVVLAAGEIGNTVLPIVAGVIAGAFFWRLGVGFTLPFLLVLVFALWVIVPGRTSDQAGTDTISLALVRDVGRELSHRPTFVTVCVLLAQALIFQGHTGLYTTYLVTEKAMAEETASIMLGLFFGASVLVHLLAGTSADYLGTKPVLAIALTIGTVAFAALPFVSGTDEIVLVTVLSSAPMGTITVGVPSLIDTLSEELQGTGFGLIRTIYLSFGTIAPFVIGILGDHGHFDAGFLLLAGISAIALLLSPLVPARETM